MPQELIEAAIEAAWEKGCPVAQEPHQTAAIARRRIRSQHRRIGENPSWQMQVRDLAKGLVARFEKEPRLVGPLMRDYEYLAERILEASERESEV